LHQPPLRLLDPFAVASLDPRPHHGTDALWQTLLHDENRVQQPVDLLQSLHSLLQSPPERSTHAR